MTPFSEADAKSAAPARRARGAIAVAAAAALALAACTSTSPRRAVPRDSAPALAADRSGDADQRFHSALKLMQTDPKAAREALLALSRDYPEMSGPLTNLGILYATSRQRREAAMIFAKAIEANPGNAVARNWLGTLYREAGDFAQAEQAYLAALQVRPDYAAAHLNLAILYDVALHRPAQAIEHYRAYQAHAVEPKLIVTAWIREIEAGAPAATASIARSELAR